MVQNGYIESAAELMKPPFDKPQSFIKLFAPPEQAKLVALDNLIKEKAVIALRFGWIELSCLVRHAYNAKGYRGFGLLLRI